MARKKKMLTPVTTMEQNRDYLFDFFTMLKQIQIVANAQKNDRFNNTEIRLMSELVYAKCKGERLISTQLAERLALTRSAISQIVGKLEAEGIVCRVDDEVDKKIAYVELTAETELSFAKIVDQYAEFIGQVIARYGVKKLDRLFAMVQEFAAAVEAAAESMGGAVSF